MSESRVHKVMPVEQIRKPDRRQGRNDGWPYNADLNVASMWPLFGITVEKDEDMKA